MRKIDRKKEEKRRERAKERKNKRIKGKVLKKYFKMSRKEEVIKTSIRLMWRERERVFKQTDEKRSITILAYFSDEKCFGDLLSNTIFQIKHWETSTLK